MGGTSEAICSIFGDDEVSDVKLKGSDGGTVVAVKAILAARSPMFRHKFYNEYRKMFVPTSPEDKEVFVFRDWDCRILHLIVEYCYTDTLSVMKYQPTEDISRIMATLRIASKVFKLPGLLDKITQWVWRQISRHPAIACAMVDEGMKNDDVDDLALQTLQLKSRAALLPNQRAVGSGVLALSKPALLFVLRTLEETTSHYLLLQAIEQWVDFSTVDSDDLLNSDGTSLKGDPNRERASREAFGRKCAMRFIKISKIPKENVDAVMKRSKLFTTNKNGVPTSMWNAGFQFSNAALIQDSPNSPSRKHKPRPGSGFDLSISTAASRTVSPISIGSTASTTMSSPMSSPNITPRSMSFSPTMDRVKSPTNTTISID
jgi:hypothetical protein